MPVHDLISGDPVVVADPTEATEHPRADVWPVEDRHGLCLLDLSEPRRRSGAAVSVLADQLAALGDARWALERDSVVADAARQIDLAAADLLVRLGKEVQGDLGECLASRADAVAGGRFEESLQMLVDCGDHRVVALYGPLKTWSSKDAVPRSSTIVSVENRSEAPALEAADALLPEAVGAVGRECRVDDLAFWHVPGFVTTDVVACGGEANTFPKHFALFLPEDAGYDDHGADTKTIVYTNVYETQFRAISAEIGEAILDPWRPVPDDAVLRTLLLWFRGHDASHFVGPGGRRVDHLVGHSSQVRGALQEAFADVVGYLVASTPTLVDATGVDPEDLTSLYLSEMLRYLRRGWRWFPDSFSARIELSHLVDGGWIEIAEVGDEVRLRWEPAGVREGLAMLGRDLCAALVAGDGEARTWLCRLCEHEPPWLASFEGRLRHQTATTGDSLVFGHHA